MQSTPKASRLRAFARGVVVMTLAAAALAVAPARAELAVVEFYNAGLDHYFMSSDPAEIADLDRGVHPGWTRTGYVFGAWAPNDTVAGSNPVCRFYGNPKVGLDSHFYSASPQECVEIPVKFGDAWLLESSDVFRTAPLDAAGACPAGTQPVYRLFNNRQDVNHRYTTSTAVYAQMVARGYIPEGGGSGPRPVIFCAPPAPVAPLAPQCTLSASLSAPAINTGIVLTAQCTNAPTSYDWGATGCSSAMSACLTGATVPGPMTYTVVASNAQGPGMPARADVTWVTSASAGSTLPKCTLDADQATPVTGKPLALTVACAGPATTVTWLACSAVSGACQALPSCAAGSVACSVTQATAGPVQYAVDVRNASGAVRVVRDVTWTRGVQPPVCALTPSNPTPGVNTSITLFADCSESPATFVWTGCTSTLSTCVATATTAGVRTYGVVAANSAGASPQANAQVTWLQLTPPAPPTCTIAASETRPEAGASITLTATCSEAPTHYLWVGCEAFNDTCVATSTTVGTQTYSVIASNDIGTGLPASISVAWQAAAGTPVCSVSANATTLWLGQTVLLQAACTHSPYVYTWQNCPSSDSVCFTAAESAGTVVYSVAGTNAVGPGAPASVSVTWRDPTDAGMCIQYPEAKFVTVPWGSLATTPGDYGGGFTPGSVLVAAFTVPATGSFTVPDFIANAINVQSMPVTQQATLSASKCDFRATDPSGITGPFASAVGHPAQVSGSVGAALQPGATYYVNVRNYIPGVGRTCGEATCNVQVNYQWPTP